MERKGGRGRWKVPHEHPCNSRLFLISGCCAHYSFSPTSLYLVEADGGNGNPPGAVDQILRGQDLEAALEHAHQEESHCRLSMRHR